MDDLKEIKQILMDMLADLKESNQQWERNSKLRQNFSTETSGFKSDEKEEHQNYEENNLQLKEQDEIEGLTLTSKDQEIRIAIKMSCQLQAGGEKGKVKGYEQDDFILSINNDENSSNRRLGNSENGRAIDIVYGNEIKKGSHKDFKQKQNMIFPRRLILITKQQKTGNGINMLYQLQVGGGGRIDSYEDEDDYILSTNNDENISNRRFGNRENKRAIDIIYGEK